MTYKTLLINRLPSKKTTVTKLNLNQKTQGSHQKIDQEVKKTKIPREVKTQQL